MCHGRRSRAGHCRRGPVVFRLARAAVKAVQERQATATANKQAAAIMGRPNTGVGGLEHAIRDMSIDDHKQALHLEDQINAEKDNATLDAPPAYSEAHEQVELPEAQIHELQTVTKDDVPPALSNINAIKAPAVESALQAFTMTLAAYRNGTGRRLGVKRARRALMNRLYETEVERREKLAGGERLKCKDRSMIWRDVKVVGDEIWDMIADAKYERRSL